MPTEQQRLDGERAIEELHRSDIQVRLLPSDTDAVMVAEINGKIVGRVELRLVPLVHGMEIEPSAISRRVAEALWNYAQGFVRATHKEALVLVDPSNDRMLRWMASRGYTGDTSMVFNVEVR